MHQIGKGQQKEMYDRLGIDVEIPPLPEPQIPIEKNKIVKKPQDYTWNHIKTNLQVAVYAWLKLKAGETWRLHVQQNVSPE